MTISEEARLAELAGFGVLDSEREKAFDDIVELAAEVTGCPTALISLLDSERQWFKARCGLEVSETPREQAFCQYVLAGDAALTVPDATLDPRFSSNPLVTGPLGLRFYAGMPLRTTSGAVLGTLCVLDYTPRPDGLTAAQIRVLSVLADQVMTQLELRRSLAEREQTMRELAASGERYRILADNATDIVSHHAPDGTTLYVSPSITTVLGYDAEQEIGTSAPERVHPEDTQRMGDALGMVMAGLPTTVGVRSLHADGTWRHLDIRLSPVRDRDGVVVELHSVARDATERVESDERLRLSEERFRVLFDDSPVGQVELSPDGVVQRCNAALAALIGVGDPSQLIGRTPDWATAPGQHSPQREDLRTVVAEPGRVIHTRRTLMNADGGEVEIEGTLVGVPGPDGRASVLIGSVVDVTERNRTARQLTDLAAELATARDEAVRRNVFTETVLDTVDVGIVACDAEGRLTMFNRATRLFHGMPPDSEADPGDWAHRYALYDADGTTLLEEAQIPLVRALTDGVVEGADIVVAPEGLPARLLRCTGRALRSPDGRPLGAVVVMTDITEARAAEHALAEQSEFTRVLLETAHTSIWACDPDGRPTYINRTARQILGWQSDVVLADVLDAADPSLMPPNAHLHRLDGTAVTEEERPLRRALLGEDVLEEELMLSVDGHAPRTMIMHASPMRDAAGHVRGALTTAHDVTALRASEARFRAAFHDGPTPVARLDVKGILLEVNPALRRLTGSRTKSLVGSDLRTLVHPDDVQRLDLVLAGSGTGPNPIELRLLRIGGGSVWCEVATTVTTDVDGVTFVLIQFLDIDARRTQERALEQAAQHDLLTGLGNRSQLAAQMQRLAGDPEMTTGLLFLDLDGFKAINDSYGHDAGDAVLVEVAARLLTCVRPEDLVLRLGGDEFVVVCSFATSASQAALRSLAARIEDAVAVPIAFGDSTLLVGGSVGTAMTEPGQQLDQLLGAADASMYARKRSRVAIKSRG